MKRALFSNKKIKRIVINRLSGAYKIEPHPNNVECSHSQKYSYC